MADLELTVRCKTLPNKIGFGVMCALFPVWALLAPTCLGLLTRFMMEAPPSEAIAFWLMTTLAMIPVLSVMLTAYFEDDRLNISKDGITFPLFMLLKLRLRKNRSWSELQNASIDRSLTGNHKKDKLILRFKSGENLSLTTGNFSKSDLEQLLLSLELWGNNCQRSSELITFQSELQNQNAGLGKQSYTQMWEEELSRRFNATSFVPLEPDKVLHGGRLKVVRQLAFGGLSAIYLAQRDNHDMVVLKEAVVPASADPDTRRKAEEHFDREAKLLVNLDHPQIAKVYDHFVDDGRNYLMLEYINGQDLRQYVKQNGPQSEEQVLDWARQIADILNYLHGQDPPIIHRDLTPDNLVLRNDGTVMLIDFGAANQFVGTATGTLVGKQAYIAPEQLRGKADLKSDLYSYGGTLYYLLTGKDPMPLAAARPSELATVSNAMDELIVKLTAFDKTERVQTAANLVEQLAQIKSQTVSSPGTQTQGADETQNVIHVKEKETVVGGTA